MPPWGWGNFLAPMFRCARTPQGIYFQLGEDFFGSTYLGVVQLALAGLAFRNWRHHRVTILAGLSAGCLLLALGEHSFVYRTIRGALPFLGFIRYPVKFVLLPAFALPLLAGYGLKAVLADSTAEPTRAFRFLLWIASALGLAILVTLWLTVRSPTPWDNWALVWHSAAWRVAVLGATLGLLMLLLRSRPVWQHLGLELGLMLLLVTDSLVGVPQKNPVLPANLLAPGLWETENKVPPPALGEGRVMISPSAEQRLLISRVPDLRNDLIGKRLALWSNLHLLESIAKVNGSSTLQIREQKQLENVLYASTNEYPNLMRFLNVTYATAPGAVVEWGRRIDALPFITAGQQPVFATDEQTLQALTNATFAPEQVVYLPPEASEQFKLVNSTPATVGSLHVTSQRVSCTVQASQASLVVVAQTFYHPWHAYVDGTPTRLWRANYTFQALQVPLGRHQVELVYEDQRLRVGSAISALSCLVVLGMMLPARRGH
jgi:hypothetical protein